MSTTRHALGAALLGLASAAALGAGGCGAPAGTDATPGTDAGSDAATADGGTPMRTDVTFTTSDGLTLTGYLTALPSTPMGAPGVLLVHQYMLDDLQWGDLPEALADQGWRVLAFDLRGHGDSDPYGGGPLTNLFTDPDGAPRDVDAALAWLGGPGGADPARIGIVGTSIGANLTVAAAIRGLAHTYAAFSSRIPPTEALAGGLPATGMTSVFYLAGELDTGGQAADAQTMFDATTPPSDIQIYPGTADHGIAILNNQPDARGLLVAWLQATL
jgi:dienelactone hydrolase